MNSIRWFEFWIVMLLAVIGSYAWAVGTYDGWNQRFAVLVVIAAIVAFVFVTIFYFYNKPDRSTEGHNQSNLSQRQADSIEVKCSENAK